MNCASARRPNCPCHAYGLFVSVATLSSRSGRGQNPGTHGARRGTRTPRSRPRSVDPEHGTAVNREHLLSCVRHPAAILSLALTLFWPRVAVLAQQNLPSTRPDEPVAEVRVRGNHNVPMHKIMAEIRTRPGLPPDEKLLQEDVRRLIATRQFFDVGVEYLHE